MAKILITTIQVNLVPSPSDTGVNTISPEFPLLKFLPLTYHHSHFMAATFDFTSLAFVPHTFFILGCFGLAITILITFLCYLYLADNLILIKILQKLPILRC